MAVEAEHLNVFPTQVFSIRELMVNDVECNGNVFGALPISSGTTMAMVPMFDCERINNAVSVSRKPSRNISFPSVIQNQTANSWCSSFTFLGEDISYQIQQHQLQIDQFIAQQMEKVRIEIGERRKRYLQRIVAAVEETVMKKLKSKDEEMETIGKLNLALEERVKSLCIENQIWRNLAQTNEATANALRCNLEQVLAQVHDEPLVANEAAIVDDAQSCYGSNSDEINQRTIADGSYKSKVWLCRCCGREESCVLLLPCRHMCLCTVCASSLHTCPVCNSIKTASVHVNLSF